MCELRFSIVVGRYEFHLSILSQHGDALITLGDLQQQAFGFWILQLCRHGYGVARTLAPMLRTLNRNRLSHILSLTAPARLCCS